MYMYTPHENVAIIIHGLVSTRQRSLARCGIGHIICNNNNRNNSNTIIMGLSITTCNNYPNQHDVCDWWNQGRDFMLKFGPIIVVVVVGSK